MSHLVLITDIDASLLEPGLRTRRAERAAIDFLAAYGIPLVINSSRTRAEIERIHRRLQVTAPFISEHGSSLFIPRDCFADLPERARPAVGGHVVVFGRPYHYVADTLKRACSESKVGVVAFSELSIQDAARELGVAIFDAQLAKLREYTELFRIVDEDDASRSRLYRALRRRGLRCWPAGRHHLVTATPDQAEAFRTLKALWQRGCETPTIVAFGDSDDDVAWLQHADVVVVVQDRRWGVPARVLSKLPTARVTRKPGREGWSEAVLEVVGKLITREECDGGNDASVSRGSARPCPR